MSRRSVSEVENKADYAELRRLYFGHRENDRTPSHSKVSNYETGIDQTIDGFSSDLHNFLTIHEHSYDEEPTTMSDNDEMGPKSGLTQRSSELINNLCDRYGNRTYNKITSMINNEDFSEWEQLEKELFASELKLNLNDLEETTESLTYDEIVNELNEMTTGDLDDDLDYLDALVQHDYSRLRKFQTDQECLSSIFSEILENEQNSNKNYEDDVFNKNIELIFNSDIDLDNHDWSEISDQANLGNGNLEETIQQLKEQCQSQDTKKEIPTGELKQADLNAFYSENKLALESLNMHLESEEHNQSKGEKSTSDLLSKGLKVYIGITFFILFVILMVILFK